MRAAAAVLIGVGQGKGHEVALLNYNRAYLCPKYLKIMIVHNTVTGERVDTNMLSYTKGVDIDAVAYTGLNPGAPLRSNAKHYINWANSAGDVVYRWNYASETFRDQVLGAIDAAASAGDDYVAVDGDGVS